MVFDIDGKYALITGGAVGLGYAFAVELFKKGLSGVVIVGTNQEHGNKATTELNQQFGNNKAIFQKADVTNKDKFEDAFKLAISTFGRLDIVINNAGVLNDNNWELEIAVNCNAIVTGSLLGIKYMSQQHGGNGGAIINISSVLGLKSIPGCPIYCASKAFIISLTSSFGTKYFSDLTGIKFITVCPGPTDTRRPSKETDGSGGLNLLDFPSIERGLLYLAMLKPQMPDNVATGLITALTEGENGSVWISEEAEPAYEIEIPDRKSIKKNH